MGTPSPFEVGYAVGTNIGKGFQAYKDKSALDQILEKANQSGDPNVINDAMQQILTRVSPEKQPMAMQILQNKQKAYQEQAERERKIKSISSLGLPPELVDADPQIIKEFMRQRQQKEFLDLAGLSGKEPQPQPSPNALPPTARTMPPFKLPDKNTPQEEQQPTIPRTKLSKEQIQMITFLNPSLGKVIQQQETDREKLEREKQKFEATQEFRNKQLEQKERQHWESTTGKWVSEQLNKLPEIEKLEETANQIKTTTGKVSGPLNRTYLSNQLGKGWEWLKSTEGNIFEAGLKNQFAGAKAIFPGRVTDNDTRIYEKGLAGVGKNKEANDLIITQEQARLAIERKRIEEMRKILKENPYIPEIQLREKIEERITPFVNKEYNKWRKALYKAAGTPLEEQEQRTSLTPEKRKTLDEIFSK